jgi:hypothetical protein
MRKIARAHCGIQHMPEPAMTIEHPPPDHPPPAVRSADKLIRDALVEELQREAKDNDGVVTTKVRLVARALIDLSIAGDVAALRELQDRIGGKPLPAVADKQPTRVTFQWKDSK